VPFWKVFEWGRDMARYPPGVVNNSLSLAMIHDTSVKSEWR
jgi:hypothetical protein